MKFSKIKIKFIANSSHTSPIADHKISKNESSRSLKILYTPYTNLTLSIIKKANRTFDSLGQVMALAQQVSQHSRYFLENFPPVSETLEGIRMVQC